MPSYSTLFDDALVFASDLHRTQKRKGTQVPYITHLLGVSAIVGDVGGTETQAIAALLHDTVEDQVEHHPHIESLIAEKFGQDVLDIVLACSDAVTHPKPPWKERKEAYIAHIRDARSDDPSLLISLADKFYNGMTLLRDARQRGEELWTEFKASPAQTKWYYETLAEEFTKKSWPTPTQEALSQDYQRLTKELGRVIDTF